jgi:hypothetical protein
LALAAALLTGTLVFVVARSGRAPSNSDSLSEADVAKLALLKPNQLLAKVGEVELRSEDLRDSLQKQFQGMVSHAGLAPRDLASTVGRALDQLIEDELLAQGARKQGLSVKSTGMAGRQELARLYVEQRVAKMPPVSDADLRSFYKNHGEKFYVPRGARVRELFLPLHGPVEKKKNANDKAFAVGQELALRVQKGESLEDLAQQHTPEAQRERARIQLFRGAVMGPEDEAKVLSLRSGQVVGPLRVEGGYSIFQGVAQIRSRLMPFREAKDKIRTYLEVRTTEEARGQLVMELQQQIVVQRFGPEKALASAR